MCVCHFYLMEIVGRYEKIAVTTGGKVSQFQLELGWETNTSCQNESILKTNSVLQHLKLLNGENETVPINYKQLNLNSVTSTRGRNSLSEVKVLNCTFKILDTPASCRTSCTVAPSAGP